MDNTPADDLESQVILAQSGDSDAMASILELLRPIFRGFFRKRLGNSADIDDLVQNTLLRVHRGLPDLKDSSKLRGFAMKAALFELNDFFRGRYSIREMLIDVLPERESPMMEDHIIDALDVDKALSHLSPRAREIIELREYGYRYEEIASRIGSTEAAVKMQVKRAFKKLKSVLDFVIIVSLWLR